MLSAVITSYNNAATLDRCLASVAFADEILLLDSFSDDASLEIAEQHQAMIAQQRFAGFGPQKQRAVDLALHDWILLLDADEALSAAAQTEIAALRDQQQLQGPGYRLRRREWLAWREPIEQHGRWQGALVRLTDHLRLFDRRQVRLSAHPVHAAPVATKRTPLLRHELLHWGDAPFARRLEKQQRYAQLLASAEPPAGALSGRKQAPVFTHRCIVARPVAASLSARRCARLARRLVQSAVQQDQGQSLWRGKPRACGSVRELMPVALKCRRKVSFIAI